MSEPIKSGDQCVVVAGALGHQGPNIGKRVKVGSVQGEHSFFGRIWRCHGDGLTSEFGATGGQADFATSWLRKLPDQKPAVNDEKFQGLAA